MEVHLNEDELRLLAYFHEHASGYGEEAQQPPEEVANALSMEWGEFTKAATYLASFGLVGKDTVDASTHDGTA